MKVFIVALLVVFALIAQGVRADRIGGVVWVQSSAPTAPVAVGDIWQDSVRVELRRLCITISGSTCTQWSTTNSVLGRLVGADFNLATDQAITIYAPRYIIRKITVYNASVNMTTAAGGVYPTTSKGGTAIVAAGQVYTALTGSTKYVDLTLTASVGTDRNTAQTIYLSLTTPQGVAATATVDVIGDVMQ
jgi:hypothetical protein